MNELPIIKINFGARVIRARSINETGSNEESVCTIGSYDGIHLAHQKIIKEVTASAQLNGMRSVVITFDPHPKEVVKTGRGPVELLTTLDERIAVFEKIGVDLLLIIPFTYEFSRLSSREFYLEYIVNGVNAKEVVVGYDHMFGYDRKAGVADIVDMGREFGFRVNAVPPYYTGNEIVSSSTIRRLIKSGEVGRAAELLGWFYSLEGKVVKGEGRGAELGFPTANILPSNDKKVMPGEGVYFVSGVIDGKPVPGMMNIGRRPTFGENGERVAEVHFFENVGMLNEKIIRVAFLKRLREEKSFKSREDLIKNLENDKRVCLESFSLLSSESYMENGFLFKKV